MFVVVCPDAFECDECTKQNVLEQFEDSIQGLHGLFDGKTEEERDAIKAKIDTKFGKTGLVDDIEAKRSRGEYRIVRLKGWKSFEEDLLKKVCPDGNHASIDTIQDKNIFKEYPCGKGRVKGIVYIFHEDVEHARKQALQGWPAIQVYCLQGKAGRRPWAQ